MLEDTLFTDDRRQTTDDRRQTTDDRRQIKPFNNKMNLLKAFGIIAVVGGHCGINFLPWFPPYSYHMPLFIFISGYFFHDKTFIAFLKSKVKHLVIPLLTWNIIFGLICIILLHYGLIAFVGRPTLHAFLLDPFLHGHQFVFNLATWFVGTLVEIQILYWALHRACRGNQIAITFVSLICYLAAWYMGDRHWHQSYGFVMLAAEKVLFSLIFYQMGYIYSAFFEKLDSFSVNRIILLIIFNGILMGYGNRSLTTGIAWMNVPHRFFLTLLTAMSGIYLLLQVSELLKDKVDRNSLLGYIGENTFSIMTLHLFFFWLLNTLFMVLKNYQLFPLRSFDYNKYMHSIWFRVTEHSPMNDAFYFIAGIGGSLVCVYLYDRYKHVVVEIFKKITVKRATI